MAHTRLFVAILFLLCVHVGDAVEIARRTGAAPVANPELAGSLDKPSDFPARQAATDAVTGIGGEIQIADGEVVDLRAPGIILAMCSGAQTFASA